MIKRMMHKPALMIIISIATVALGGAAFALADQFPGSGTPVKIQPSYTVRDTTGNEIFAAQPQKGVSKKGEFGFALKSVGGWHGQLSLGPTSSRITHLKGNYLAIFASDGSLTKPQIANFRIEGEIDTARHSATINIRANESLESSLVLYLLRISNPLVNKADNVTKE